MPHSTHSQRCKFAQALTQCAKRFLTHQYSASIFTPINVILLFLFALIAYYQLRPKPAVTLPKPDAPILFRTFTPHTLLPFNGRISSENPNSAVYLAVRGKVFDVTLGKQFYGPGGPYSNFAGRDASRGLAFGSFDEEMLTKDLDGLLDKLADLENEEWEALKGWQERFDEKYLVVGELISVDEAAARETEKEKVQEIKA